MMGSKRDTIMANVLAYDVESTGLLPKHFSLDKVEKLPHIVQLAAILFDNQGGNELASMNVIIKPESFVIPPEATAIHGISHEQAMDEGISLTSAVEMYDQLRAQSVGMIAHNIDYDYKMMAIAYKRVGRDESLITKSRKKCTMKASTDLCKIPGNWGYKWPKLVEAYKIFFDEELEGAHDALIDIRATVRVYLHLRTMGAI